MPAERFANRQIIEQRQIERLRALLGEILPANPFYAAKFGATLPPSSLADYSQRFAFTLKEELVEDQRRHPPYGTDLTHPLERYTRCHQTSGTGGAPLRWLDTPETWGWMLANWEQVHRAAGTTRADRVFFAFSFGPFLGFWLAFEAAARLGCLCLPGGGLSSVMRLRTIFDCAVTVLCCTPSYAIRLAEVAAEEKIDLSAFPVKLINVAGEPGGSIPATRARIEALWPGARVYDHHGMTEVGPVTYECPARPCVLHVMEHAYIAEVIDHLTGRPVPPGEAGELVLTTLGRTGSPLLRYRTGDLVKSAPDTLCACGRNELALEGGILGRTDDMVVVRGVNVYPSAVDEIVRACAGVAEYQVHINTRQTLIELAVQIEPGPSCGDLAALARKLEKSFYTVLGLRVPVTGVSPGTLPRFEMKAKRWVNRQT